MLRSTFSGFTTATLAMRSSQKALDVTGQNIANINTAGYTRQRLDIVSLNTKNGNFYSSKHEAKVGFGVNIEGISQIRDPFLDIQYRNQIAKVGTTDAKKSTLDLISNIFDETTRTGIKDGLSSFSSALHELSQPGKVNNKVLDSVVRSSAQVLIELFHQNATELKNVQSDLVEQISETDLVSANNLMEEISKLNETIKNSQILGNPALELQDTRNMMLDELATYLPIKVTYNQESIAQGTTVDVLNVSFRDTNGTSYSLINDNTCGSFSVSTTDVPLTFEITDTQGITSGDLADSLGNGSFSGTLNMINKQGSFSGDDTKGIGFYGTAFDSFVATFANTFNSLNVTSDGTLVPLFETSDGSNVFTAANIKISERWMSGEIGIIASSKPDAGSSDNDNILCMINALESKTDFLTPDGQLFFKGTFQEAYSNIENIMGIDLKSTNTLLTNNIAVIQQISNSRDSISAVSLDEEGMNLLQFNKSYSAAARLMTTLDEALDTLINKTGVVGR